MAKFTVLIIDSDPEFRSAVRATMQGEGFQVLAAASGQEGLGAFEAEPAHLVLLDPALPDMSGADVCQSLRTMPGGEGATVILMSERREMSERVTGFHAGADSFLLKPIDLYELLLRVKAVQRRIHGAPTLTARRLQVGRLKLDADTRVLTTPEGTFTLSPTEFQLMHCLMRTPGTMLSTETLLRTVWHYPAGTGAPEVVRSQVRVLRKKIEPDPANPVYLVSAQLQGYMVQDGSSRGVRAAKASG